MNYLHFLWISAYEVGHLLYLSLIQLLSISSLNVVRQLKHYRKVIQASSIRR